MKIVILDGYCLNPGDLTWVEWKELGECEIYDRTPAALVRERIHGAEIVITNKTQVNGDSIAATPELRYIGVLATGFNIVDVEAAASRNIPVTNVPTYGTESVAQMTFALLLELVQHAGHHSDTVHDGRWSRSQDFCYWDHPLIELSGLKMGLIGIGRIGQAAARIAHAFGMSVMAADPNPPSGLPGYIQIGDVNAVIRDSDVVSLHCPLTAENERFINTDKIRMMKKSAYLINTSRGQLINEADLAAALDRGDIAGAAVDVLSIEPPAADNPLLTAKNCIITPHISWATEAARKRLMRVAVDNLKAFLEGNVTNRVN
ncbi:MAG: D-2-hydroxyacid dehydrogenase [Calditrichales bacterium]|nr:MAG: D-2-hydroxyacid dehydrogenase [Calditrichales bacterium]